MLSIEGHRKVQKQLLWLLIKKIGSFEISNIKVPIQTIENKRCRCVHRGISTIYGRFPWVFMPQQEQSPLERKKIKLPPRQILLTRRTSTWLSWVLNKDERTQGNVIFPPLLFHPHRITWIKRYLNFHLLTL